MVTVDANVPTVTLGDRERMEHLTEIWEHYWSSERWKRLTHFVLLATDCLLDVHLHFDDAIKFVAISLGFTVGPALIWTKSFNLFHL